MTGTLEKIYNNNVFLNQTIKMIHFPFKLKILSFLPFFKNNYIN